MTDWIDWQALELSVGLDDLPTFHREFLKLNRAGEADWDTVFLRQIQGKVQATLKQLERANKARFEGDVLFVFREAIPEAYRD